MQATEHVVAFINRTHSTDFTLDHRLEGGFQNGAYALNTPDGTKAVLKWTPRPAWTAQVRRAQPIIAAAREAGWPTPAWLLVGTTPDGFPYQVQEYAEGSHPEGGVTRKLAQAILPVLDIQAGLKPDTTHDWATYDHAVVFADEDGFSSTVAAFSADGAQLVEHLRAWTAPHQSIKLRDTDLVHGDFNPGNIFLRDGRVSAVVDAEALGKGSRFHDLATLLLEAHLFGRDPGAVEDLLAYAHRRAEPGELEVCYASCLLGWFAFVLTHNPKIAVASFPKASASLW